MIRFSCSSQTLRKKRKEAINLAHSMGSEGGGKKQVDFSGVDKVAAMADDISLVSSNASIGLGGGTGKGKDVSGFGGAGAGVSAVNVTQPSPMKEFIGHPRLDALLSSF